jgi:hypothetical protein
MTRHRQPTAYVQARPFPTNVSEFLDHLDFKFPEQEPRAGDTLDTIMFKAGQRAVALQMRREFEASLKRKED